jgi:hypothetical protein
MRQRRAFPYVRASDACDEPFAARQLYREHASTGKPGKLVARSLLSQPCLLLPSLHAIRAAHENRYAANMRTVSIK